MRGRRKRAPTWRAALAGARWGPEEEAILKATFTPGGSIQPVVEALCQAGYPRTPHACTAKAFTLGLTKTYRRGKGAQLLAARAEVARLRRRVAELEADLMRAGDRGAC